MDRKVWPVQWHAAAAGFRHDACELPVRWRGSLGQAVCKDARKTPTCPLHRQTQREASNAPNRVENPAARQGSRCKPTRDSRTPSMTSETLGKVDCSKTLKLCFWTLLSEPRASIRHPYLNPKPQPIPNPHRSHRAPETPTVTLNPSVWCAAPEVVPIFEARRVSEIRIIRSATAFCGNCWRRG